MNLGHTEEGYPFRKWMKQRLDHTMAESNVDFIIGTLTPMINSEQFSRKNVGGIAKHKRKDYILSIHLAKELAMLERSSIGRQIRKYFIRCKEELKRILTPIKQEAPVPRAKDDSLAYLNKKLNSTYTRAQ